ncbi:MAG: hypothetical protein HKO76_08070 [Acidimicrobiia bacterium]|nr:hypothetical protein [Acidimicrobiia bacterium]
MKRIALVLGVFVASLMVAAPAGALSCMPPDPIDWEEWYPRLDAALVVEIDSVKETTAGTYAGSLTISATVRELLKGRVGERIEYSVPSLNPWGPYYEVGDRIAVVSEDGVISDGRQNICGPWFEPDELRRAAELYGDSPSPPQPKIPAPAPEPVPIEPPPGQPEPPNPAPEPIEPPASEGPHSPWWEALFDILRFFLTVLGLR